MERRLAAILAADVVGYSRLMGADEEATLAKLNAYRAVIDALVADHRGRVFGSAGDSVIAEFASPVEAVRCAIAIQLEIEGRDVDLAEDRRMRLRIGVNLGDVMAEGDNLFGDGVNVAARLEEIAEPGDVCISAKVHDEVAGKTDGVFIDAGEHRVKNITAPIRVWRWSEAGGVGEIQRSAEVLTLPDKPSIAVLPFTNMSGDTEQEYFSDGITEDIITELSRFGSLFVIARNSSFAYKGQPLDIREVARELGVRYVLEGSVRRGGDRLRITAQLLDRDSGSHVWGERYDGDMADVFALQDEITRNVVGSIAPQIELAEMERSRKLSDTDLTAYELSLKAQAFHYDALRAADPVLLDRAMSAADAALELDARNTHALWSKTMILLYQHIYLWGDDPAAALTAAGETADRLMRIDPSNAISYLSRAIVHQYRKDFDAAIADHRRALELNPNYATNLFLMAWGESVAGRAAEAREHAHMALRLSPRDTDIWLGEGYAALALASFTDCDYAEALKWGRLSVQMHAKMPVRQALMIACNAHLGDLEAAKTHADTLTSFSPDFIPRTLSGNIVICHLPEHNALLMDGLRLAGLSE